MTDRIFALTVLLETDTRTDDIEDIIKAIQMIKGVMKVETHISTHELWAAEERAKRELRQKLWSVLYPVKDK